MDIMDIACRSGVDPRRLRYAVYHMLMPGVARVSVGRGSIRHFMGSEAFGIALAAMLLDAGLKRELVIDCFKVVTNQHAAAAPSASNPLDRAFISRGPVHLEVGDRRFVRLRAGRARGSESFDTGWIPADGGMAAPADYEPVVAVRINLTPLREALREGQFN
jgi:hypothetical protein